MNGAQILLLLMLALASALAVADDWSTADERACQQGTAGRFKYYVLSLSWSPEFCRSHPKEKSNETQCRERRQFIVHGLWPECQTEGPEHCKKGGAADPIDEEKIHAFMPSDYLIQHEWDKHGTCSGLDRSAYFNLIGELYGKLKLPRLSGAPKPVKIESLFMAKNPGLDSDEIYLSCTERGPKSSGKTLDEVRICFDRETHGFTRCEHAKDTCRKLRKVEITPAK